MGTVMRISGGSTGDEDRTARFFKAIGDEAVEGVVDAVLELEDEELDLEDNEELGEAGYLRVFDLGLLGLGEAVEQVYAL